MSVMILVVLAVVWVVALTPWVLRKLAERNVVTSVSSFNRQLLRLGTQTDRSDRGSMSVPGAPIGFSAAAQRVHERIEEPNFDAGVRPGDPKIVVPAVPVTSHQTALRRRRVVTSLAGATLFFFLVGLIPAARIMWVLALVCLAFAAAYIAALIHYHRLAVEHAQKVVALETRRSVVSALDRARLSQASGTQPPQARLRGSGWSVTDARGREFAATGQ